MANNHLDEIIRHAKAGNYEAVIRICDEVIEYNPNDSLHMYSIKGKNLHKLKRYAEAIQAYNRFLEIEPDNLSVQQARMDSLNQLKN